jgi:hypothetical protein
MRAADERPGPRKQCFLPDQEPSGRLTFAFDSIRPRGSSSNSSSNWRQTASDNRTLPASSVDSMREATFTASPQTSQNNLRNAHDARDDRPARNAIFLSEIYFAVSLQILSHVPIVSKVSWTLSFKKVRMRNQAI